MAANDGTMRVAISADHAGFPLKAHLVASLAAQGVAVDDLGTDSDAPVDYPDITVPVGDAVTSGRATRGIVICGSGVGACIAANKIKGIRAGLCHDTYSAHQGVEHDDTNVLVLGARIIGTALADEIVAAFLGARFTNEERHVRRRDKVIAIENRS